MNIYKFILYYIHVIEVLEERGYSIDDKKRQAINYASEINTRSKSEAQVEDNLYKACLKIYNTLFSDNAVKQDENILEYLGINENPVKVLFEADLGESHLVGYTACFIDKRSDRARYEMVWFPIETTFEEALLQTTRQYKHCIYTPDGVRLEGRVERHQRSYIYKGYIYTYNL